MFKITLTLILLLSPLAIFAQTVVSGKVSDDSHAHSGIRGAELILTYRSKSGKLKRKYAYTNNKGFYSVDIETKLALNITFEITAGKGYEFLKVKKRYVPQTGIANFTVTDELNELIKAIDATAGKKIPFAKREIERGKAKSTLMLKENSKETVPVEDYIEKEKEIDEISSQFKSLKVELAARTIDKNTADRRIAKLSEQLDDAMSDINVYVVKLYDAYMKSSCLCEGYEESYLKLSFKLSNEYEQPPSVSKRTFRIYVYKIEHLRRDEPRDTLTYTPDGTKFREIEISNFDEPIEVVFTSERGSFKEGAVNYNVEIYNTKFGKPLNSFFEITSLKEKCKPRKNNSNGPKSRGQVFK